MRARFHSFPGSEAARVTGPNYFIAGLILAIMILPIISAVSREVIATAAREKEAALALGATRWEMIRIAVLPYAGRDFGGAMLGLGRALGETMAVMLVIGNAPVIGKHLFARVQPRRCDRERVRRGGQHADPQLGAVCGGARVVRADADRKYHRALVRR